MTTKRLDVLDGCVPDGTSIEHVVLSDVISGYRAAVASDDEESRRFVAAVERWMGDATGPSGFAFSRMCRALGIDDRRLRRRLLELRSGAAFWRERSTG